MGVIAESDGLPRIAGQIMGLVVLEGGPLSFAEIADKLKVSRGSVSTNTRFLERLGVIERVARRGDRQDYFQLSPAPYGRLLQGSADRLNKAVSVVEQAKAGVSPSDRSARRRLNELAKFYGALSKTFEELAQRFSEHI